MTTIVKNCGECNCYKAFESDQKCGWCPVAFKNVKTDDKICEQMKEAIRLENMELLRHFRGVG